MYNFFSFNGSYERKKGDGVVDRIAPDRRPSCPADRLDVFFGYYFSNATLLYYLFAETSFPMGNKHICLCYERITDMLT